MKRKVHVEFSDIKELTFCGNPIGYEASVSAFEVPFPIGATKGKHDYITCKQCQINLAKITKQLSDTYKGKSKIKAFPNCCVNHARLKNRKAFNVAQFNKVPEWTAQKIIFTAQHVTNNIDSENWYKQITHYIDWAVDSFGQMPVDCGSRLFLREYYISITDLINKNSEIPNDKKLIILNFIADRQNPANTNKTDITLLIETYEKWFKLFPFDLHSYFGNLKEKFQRHLPIFTGKPEINMYSGKAAMTAHSKASLIVYLVNLTNQLITETNATTLHEKGLLSDLDKIQFELLLNSRKLKLKTGYKQTKPDDENQYKEMLKEWFADELKFFSAFRKLIIAEPDTEFIKGEITLDFTPQGSTGYFEVIKGHRTRKYTIEQLFNLELLNWEAAIDNAITKEEKLVLTNKAIFILRKHWLTYTHPLVERHKEKAVLHLQHIAEYINSTPASVPAQRSNAETKTEKIKAHLLEYGFFDLPTVKPLTDVSKQKLIDLISANALPYQVAMFEYLGFIKYLERERIATKYKMYRTVSNWLGADKDGRSIRGLLNSLLPRKEKANERYTAYLHKEKVKKDYLLLK